MTHKSSVYVLYWQPEEEIEQFVFAETTFFWMSRLLKILKVNVNWNQQQPVEQNVGG